ncbi:MAG: LamG domain-containing protein [Planctomycetes bacterium]|nr:LamG domain-containing protein [Planctomycetota bacterium]
MSKKKIYLMAFVFMLAAALTFTASADPHLAAWWKLDDEGTGTVIDSSGNGHDGTLVGDAHFVPGLFDEALELDGENDYAVIDGYQGIVGDGTNTPAFSVTAWVRKQGPLGGNGEIVGWGNSGAGNRMEFRFNGGNNRIRIESGGGNAQNDTELTTDQWHHVALTVRENSTYESGVNFFLDGLDDTRANTDSDPIHPTGNNDVKIGLRYNEDARLFTGLIDDVRIYDKKLAGTEVQDIMTLGYRARAYSPGPSDGVMHTDTWATLNWDAGEKSVSHDVYFGASLEDVNAGVESTFVGNTTIDNQPVGFPGFPAPEGLLPGSTYYWRVDEVNEAHPDSPWKGKVWSFWIPFKTGYNPAPIDGAQFEPTNAGLSWGEGMNAIMQAVYFGIDANEVANATGAPTQMVNTFDPGPLESETIYYWRVDTFNGAEWITGTLWSFRTMPIIPQTDDPSLVAWWKLDEGFGTTVVDYSGNNHHGKFTGEVEWVDGIDGGALRFPSGWVEMTEYEGVLGTQNRTVTAWINTTGYGDIVSWGLSTEDGQKWIFCVNHNAGNGIFETLRTECAGSRIVGSTVLTDGKWHHVASVLESGGAPTINNIKLYVDGQREIISDSQVVDVNTVSDGRKVWLGEGHHNRMFPGLIDDIRIYEKALTQDEIKLLMRGDLFLAWDPEPPKGRTVDIESALPLRWKAGDNAAQHDVYLGTDKEAVSNADATDTTGLYRSRQSFTNYNPPEGVEWGGGPYYWRIDEYNTDDTISKGKVWNFTVADFILVDDFESYNDLDPEDPDSNRIFNVWLDGFDSPATNGSVVGYDQSPFTEQTIIHGGGKSMPFAYDNAVGKSEATLTITGLRDWTKYGIEILSLWFRGDSANAPEPMYVVLNGSAAVTHDNPNAAQIDTWTQWNINLQAFADQGVNLANVNTITIGFGNQSNPVTGGSGMMLFDDIQLNQSVAEPAP